MVFSLQCVSSGFEMMFNPTGNLQGPEEVLQAGVRGGEQRPGEHGHHCRLLHAQGHQGRGGIPQGPHPFYSITPLKGTVSRDEYFFLGLNIVNSA
jgi:hypothetical protein